VGTFPIELALDVTRDGELDHSGTDVVEPN
jgi:hypothetical protein